MSESWVKEWCSKCGAVNWFCLGDLDDITAPDIEACECYKCGHKWWTAEDEDIAAMQGCEVSKLPELLKKCWMIEKGRESP